MNRAVALLGLALGGTAAGCSRDALPRRPDVVLFTVDTLRADRVGAYGNRPAAGSPTPLADRLAAEGALLERCFAPRGQTHPSLASMLTGKYPITHGLRENGQPLWTGHVPFPVLFKAAGYRTAGFCANLDVTRWPFWVRGFDVAEDGLDGRLLEEGYEHEFLHQATWDERVVQKALRWIRALPAERDAPLLLWVHLYDVHQPFTPAPALAARYTEPGYRGPLEHPTGPPGAPPSDVVSTVLDAWTLQQAEPTAADLRRMRALYDAGVAGCDARLTRVADALAARGILDDALVVYASDHGEELADHHDYSGHGASIYDAVLHVPMIVRWPGRIPAGRQSAALTQNLDLFPTLLEAAGLAIPPDCEGVSLLPLLEGRSDAAPRSHAYAEWQDLIYSVADGAWKYIHNPRGARPRKPPYQQVEGMGFPYQCFELYHVAVDPREQVDRYHEERARAAELRAVLDAFLRSPEHRHPMVQKDEDDPGLAAIGYVGDHRTGVVTIDCGDDE